MSSAKTNKSYTKRLKVTRTGKIKARRPGLNHYNARQSRSTQLEKKRGMDVKMSHKHLSRVMPHRSNSR